MKKYNLVNLPIKYLLSLLAISICLMDCQSGSDEITALPFLGKQQVKQVVINGITKDTLLPHRIPDFEIINQYGKYFGAKDLAGKVYLTEFFFTSCPSVCPKVAKQMEAIHKQFVKEPNFALVSFTLDSKYDTPSKLFDYAEKKVVNHSNWYFLTGNKDTIYDLAEEGYFVAAYQNTTRQNDNIMHDGVLVLIDHQGHVRGMFDGKELATVARVENAVKQLLLDKVYADSSEASPRFSSYVGDD